MKRILKVVFHRVPEVKVLKISGDVDLSGAASPQTDLGEESRTKISSDIYYQVNSLRFERYAGT